MSRIGKKTIVVPKGVKVAVNGDNVFVEGSKGKLTLEIPFGISVESKDEKIFVNRKSDIKQDRSNHGTIRARIVNMMTGVSTGHKKKLEIQGIGFRAQIQGQKIVLNLGFSHPVEFVVPNEIQVKAITPTELEFESIDNVSLGNIVAKIRKIKPPEPYKGKGIRYSGEIVKRKQGKSVTK
ncbi:MAG: 50S ribosomal protein L6 [Candidatus Omnitrophica bacterium]|nr:50S ribosomal protein L6 [Candidatus Omnitrophota bacterium]